MFTGRRSRVAAALMTLALLATSACSQRDDDDNGTEGGGGDGGSGGESAAIDTSDCAADPTAEIEGDTIRLVSSYPQSGNAASLGEVSAGWNAYFEMVNDAGGVEVAGETYQIETEASDDAYDPGQTATNITELVGSDGSGAFAVFNVIGTAGNLAIRELLNDLCVPHLHAASGSPAWGNEQYPWTVGASNPVYTLETQVFADLLSRENPDATVAMLLQDDDFGTAYEEGLRQAIEGTDIEIVEVQRYQPGVLTDVSAQMTALTSSGADTFFDGGVGLPCSQGVTAANDAGWERELTYVSAVCVSKTILGQDPEAFAGSYTVGNLLNPMDPANEEALAEFRQWLGQASPDTDPESGNAVYGWTEAALFVQALEAAEAPTRLALMESYQDLTAGDDVGLLADGLSVSLGEDDRYLGENVELVQFQYTSPDEPYYYARVEGQEPYDFDGQTVELTPEDLITG